MLFAREKNSIPRNTKGKRERIPEMTIRRSDDEVTTATVFQGRMFDGKTHKRKEFIRIEFDKKT
jgi:hypothetical protein